MSTLSPTSPPWIPATPFVSAYPGSSPAQTTPTSPKLIPRSLFNHNDRPVQDYFPPQLPTIPILRDIQPIIDSPELPALPSPPATEDFVSRYRAMFNYHYNPANRYTQPNREKAKLSTTNLRNNEPWGDILSISKPTNTVRLFFQNVNGIKLDDTGGEMVQICSALQHLNCDIVGLCEVKLDVSKYAVKKILNTTLRRQFSSSKCSAATSEVPFDGFYKPGGTCTLSFNNINSRYSTQFEDTMGRWSTITMNGQKGRLIHFITDILPAY
jgi:hypothetical protein